MSRVILSGHITVPATLLSSVRQALPSHIDATTAESGCIVFEVSENTEVPGRFDVYEEFESETAFEHHQRRTSESEWGTIAKDVGRHYTVEGLDD